MPVVAHESDLTPGLANRLVLPFVATLCVSFAQTKIDNSRVRVVHTGTPLRDTIVQGDAARGRRLLGLQDDRPLLIVTGGSLGADALNQAVRDSLIQLTERFVVLHVCGPGKLADVEHPGYMQREYIDEGWGDILAAAEIVLSRAGANALFELLALRKLNLLVPLSAQASRGDQLSNAGYAKQQGYSAVLDETELTTENLLNALADLTTRQDEYRQALGNFIVPDAAKSISSELLSYSIGTSP